MYQPFEILNASLIQLSIANCIFAEFYDKYSFCSLHTATGKPWGEGAPYIRMIGMHDRRIFRGCKTPFTRANKTARQGYISKRVKFYSIQAKISSTV